MAIMLNIDRHIAFQAGWVAGPAFGVAMMAAPNYFKLEPPYSGLLFWGGIFLFSLTIVVVLVLSLHEDGRRRAVFWPILTMALGALIFCGGTAWYFWPTDLHQETTKTEGPAQSHIEASVPKLFMECVAANLPAVWPKGPLYVLQLNPIPAPYGNGLGEYGVNSGSPINFGLQGMVYRCQITNYSKIPIFNSVISLHMRLPNKSLD